MDAIKVKDLAKLVLKAYIRYGVSDSRVSRRWLDEQDLYGAERAVAQSFHAFNGDSIISMEQICQRGREVACENRGPLFQAWCAIKEVIENDLIYEEQPFAPAKSISRTVLFNEYMIFGEKHRHIPTLDAAKEFNALASSFDGDTMDAKDISAMLDKAVDCIYDVGVLDALRIIGELHFGNPTCQPRTIEAKAQVTEERESMRLIMEDKTETQKRPGRKKLDFQARLDKVYGIGEIELVGEYSGIHEKVTLRCGHCGKEWKRIANIPLGCPRCTAREAVENHDTNIKGINQSEEFRKEYLAAFLEKYGNGEYTIDEAGSSDFRMLSKVVLTHKSCGASFETTVKSATIRLQLGKGICPVCRKSGVKLGGEKMSNEVKKNIRLSELQEYYNKSYAQNVCDNLVTGWKSLVNSMRGALPKQYPLGRVSNKGQHIDIIVPLEDIEQIAYYYAVLAAVPTTDDNTLRRAIRNSKVWETILKDIKTDFKAEEDATVQQATLSDIENELSDSKDEPHDEDLRDKAEKAVMGIEDMALSKAVCSIIIMLEATKAMGSLPADVVAYIAELIGIKADADNEEVDALRARIAELQDELDATNSRLGSVKELLIGA